MSKHIKFAKIGNTIRRFEKSIEYINRKIDERSQNGKTNEDDDFSNHHFVGVNDDGGRCWSF